jgi:tripartite ATP-independent transporter DctP family solute receptor
MKKFVLLLIAATVLVSIVACSSSPSSTPSEKNDQPQGKPVSLDFATGFSGEQTSKMMSKFKELAESKSNGQIKINIFENATLGNERDVLENLVTGSVGMSLAGISDVVYWLPKYFLSAPYLFRDQAHVRKVYEGELGKKIDQMILEQKDLRTLAIMNRGPRFLTSNKKVEKPEDVKGLRIRMPENPLWIGTWSALGANATTITLSELYTALQTGIVDAQENPLDTIVTNHFNEVQKYLILTAHVRDVYKIQISEKVWKKMTPDQQQIVQTAAVDAAKEGDVILDKLTKDQMDLLKSKGMQIIEPDLNAFSNALSKVGKDVSEKYMEPGLYETVRDKY